MAYCAQVEGRSAGTMPKTSSPTLKGEGDGAAATMPEKSWPGIVWLLV